MKFLIRNRKGQLKFLFNILISIASEIDEYSCSGLKKRMIDMN